MNISQIINKFLPVRNIGAKDCIFYPRSGSLAAGANSVLVNTSKPFVIDYLEWSCNSINAVRIQIEVTTKDGVKHIGVIPSTNGSSLQSSTRPDNILNNYSGIWDILEFNESTNAYKFRLNLRGVECPKGVKITLENTGSNTQSASAILYGRELD